MPRDIRFDIARAVCMCYIIAILHLSQYLRAEYYIYDTFIGRLITFSCLGLFTFMSGFLIGRKYNFTPTNHSQKNEILRFYKKRFVRIYPLFFLATILLCLIGFNSPLASLWGLLGVAPFVTHQPKTLWYVSMLIFFYLITPFVNRDSTCWKIIVSAGLVFLFALLKLVTPVDTRFIFNLFFYCLGLILSGIEISYINKTDYSLNWLHITVIVGFVILLLLTNHYFPNSITLLSVGAMGVMAFFSLSNLLSHTHNKVFYNLIGFVSYASMVCYMFHRFFYWVGLNIYSPINTTWKATYLVVVFFIGLVISFFIQKGYDNILTKKINKSTVKYLSK